MNDGFYDGGVSGERFGDRQWLKEQIDLLPIAMQKDVSNRYKEIYRSLAGDEAQRFRSNSWLRKVVKKSKVVVDKNSLAF